MSQSRQLLELADRGRAASRVSAPVTRTATPTRQRCPECGYLLTRENEPHWVCEVCELLFCAYDASFWTRSRLPGTGSGQHAPNRSGSRADVTDRDLDASTPAEGA